MNKNIVLVGLMGSGKTVAGKKLSQVLAYDFLDVDEYIVMETGMSIPHIFEKYGELSFREIENQLITGLNVNNCVISTGGGVVKNPENMYALKKNAITIYLQASPKTLFENMRGINNRPLLNTGNRLETITELLEERQPLYNKYADEAVTIDGKSVDEVVSEIMRIIKAGYIL